MADMLLRERAAVLARTLDSVGRVIDVLEAARTSADALPWLPEEPLDSIDRMTVFANTLTSLANEAQFPGGKRRDFEVTLAELREDLRKLKERLGPQERPSRIRATLRLEQLVGSLSDAVENRTTQLNELIGELDAPEGLPDAAARDEAWRRCRRIQAHCERLFADYLDLIRGVALRDSGLDDGLCRIADTLMSEIGSAGVITWESLTVPASRERWDDPAATIVRIGFPEWSVWTLPLVAVEFGSFLTSEHKRTIELHTHATETAKAALVGRTRLNKALVSALASPEADSAAERGESAVKNLVGIVLVESLATVTVGPAYAWSALLMRVNPRRGLDLVERLRRDTVLTALAGLPDRALVAAKVDLLGGEWDGLLNSAGIEPAGPLDESLRPICELVVRRVQAARARWHLLDADWALIERLADLLVEARSGAEVVETIRREHFEPTVRHILNGGWVARLARPELDRFPAGAALPPLSQALKDACVALVEGPGPAPQPKSKPPEPGPGRNPTLPPVSV